MIVKELATIIKIIYWNHHQTVLFAVEELRRLMRTAGHTTTIHGQPGNLIENEQEHILLLSTDEYNTHFSGASPVTIRDDGFAIISSAQNTWIIGNEPRAILYGVYAYCEKKYGYQWAHIKEEQQMEQHASDLLACDQHEPLFARRGNILETINDPGYINALIDWGVKNGHNEYFFTFFLWDEMKTYIAPELAKRDVHVTLGGHSLSYLLKAAGCDLEQESKLLFFGGNQDLQTKVIDKIVEICQEHHVISRISLWPEDIGIGERNAAGFLTTYIQFTEKLQTALLAQNLPVEVEHIVYNAGLAWNMLEREERTQASKHVDILYAFWGRDYSEALHSERAEQIRANHALTDWVQQANEQGKALTVLEYYSDHFMLSELFPPLLTTIQRDLQAYKQMNVHGVLNLIVPIHKKGNLADVEAAYPWKWVHQFNNYAYAKLAWGMDVADVAARYFSECGADKEEFYHQVLQLEKLISPHTKWNFPLFPARVVDPEKVEKGDASVIAFLQTVNDALATWDVAEIETLLPIQTADNFTSFTTKEMLLIYVHYLRKIAGHYLQEWHAKTVVK